MCVTYGYLPLRLWECSLARRPKLLGHRSTIPFWVPGTAAVGLQLALQAKSALQECRTAGYQNFLEYLRIRRSVLGHELVHSDYYSSTGYPKGTMVRKVRKA